jgi:hypothetical protein
MPIASTRAWKPMWKNQGNLDFTYLIGANDNVLLLKGDDGGFSGMHMASSFYALNRQTGDNLLLPYRNDLLLLQKKDGKVLRRDQNMLMGYAEMRDKETRNGTLNIIGNEIYVGSANGTFTRFSK